MTTNWYAAALGRVRETPELKPYEPQLMSGYKALLKHWHWVATAPVGEVVRWLGSPMDE